MCQLLRQPGSKVTLWTPTTHWSSSTRFLRKLLPMKYWAKAVFGSPLPKTFSAAKTESSVVAVVRGSSRGGGPVMDRA